MTKQPTYQEQLEQQADPVCSLRAIAFKLGIDRLGKEAKEVLRLIWACPGELADFTIEQADISQTSIRMYMRSCGWTHHKINRAFKQIKSLLTAVNGL